MNQGMRRRTEKQGDPLERDCENSGYSVEDCYLGRWEASCHAKNLRDGVRDGCLTLNETRQAIQAY